jgi:hypothetical protein
MDKLKNAVDNDGKLRTDALFKTNFCREPYLLVIKDKHIRACLTKLRISSHKLKIEIWRYKKINSDKRFCEVCNSNEVEDDAFILLLNTTFYIMK